MNPYTRLRDIPSFDLTSEDISQDRTLNLGQVSAMTGMGGLDRSPHLSWSNAPSDTKSFVVTAFDPDAPTPSGFWHWAVANIPASVVDLETNAGAVGSDLLPQGAVTLRNDGGFNGYVGAAPPAGDGAHNYFFAVHAVDVEELDVSSDSSPAMLSFQLHFHAVARAVMSAPFEVPAGNE